MITPSGLLAGYVITQGFGSWTLSTAEDMTLEFDLKNAVANFQVSRYNMGVNSVSQSSMTFTMKDPEMTTGLKGEGSLYMTFTMKYK